MKNLRFNSKKALLVVKSHSLIKSVIFLKFKACIKIRTIIRSFIRDSEMLVLTTESGVYAPESGLDVLSETIYQSNFVKKHFDFYQWQQQYVNKFIPHNVLIAAWGDFDKGSLQFDICSSVPEIHSQQLISGCNEVGPLMSALFKKWEENDDKWVFYEEFKLSELGIDLSPADEIITELLPMRTVLVYGFRDKRSNSNVLYAFLNSHLMYETQTSVLSAIMPHLDAALRRVDCLPENQESKIDIPPILRMISEREASVLKLLIQGQSNPAIAEQLFISVNTVKNHLKNIYKKMGVSSRAQAVAKYLQASNTQQSSKPINNIHRLSA